MVLIPRGRGVGSGERDFVQAIACRLGFHDWWPYIQDGSQCYHCGCTEHWIDRLGYGLVDRYQRLKRRVLGA